MKRRAVVALALLLAVSVLASALVLGGCSNSKDPAKNPTPDENPVSPDSPSDPNSNPDNNDPFGSEVDVSPSDIPSDTPPKPIDTSLDSYLAEGYSDSRQVILVTVKNYSATNAVVQAFQKTDAGWISKFTDIGWVGENGTVEESRRVQDTNTTPLGIYRIIAAMGIAQDPGSIFPYTQIKEGMYWDLNSGSETYNRLVTSDPGGNREVLWKMGDQYNYILNTSYNEDQTPNKGGAIFIHVTKFESTAGCVALPENIMKDLVCWVDPEQKPIVIISLASDAPAVN